jgi:hypothetical protein
VLQEVVYVPVGFLALSEMPGQTGFQPTWAQGTAAVAVEACLEGEEAQPAYA